MCRACLYGISILYCVIRNYNYDDAFLQFNVVSKFLLSFSLVFVHSEGKEKEIEREGGGEKTETIKQHLQKLN